MNRKELLEYFEVVSLRQLVQSYYEKVRVDGEWVAKPVRYQTYAQRTGKRGYNKFSVDDEHNIICQNPESGKSFIIYYFGDELED